MSRIFLANIYQKVLIVTYTRGFD